MSLGYNLKRFIESHGNTPAAVQATRKKLSESYKRGKVTGQQLGLRGLVEGFLGYNWRQKMEQYRQVMARGPGAMATGMHLTEAVTDSSQFAAITGQLLVDATWEKFNAPEFIGTRLARTIPSGPNLGEHTVPGHSRVLHAPNQVHQGQEYPRTTFRQRFKTLPAVAKYGEVCEVTMEMLDTDLTGQAVESAQSVGWQVRFWQEEQILNIILGLTNNYKEASGGATTSSAKNTYQSTDWDNTQTGETLTNLRPIQKLRVLMRRITDPDTGKRIDFNGRYPLLVMPEREMDAARIVSASQVRMGDITTGDGDQTISSNPISQHVSEILSSSIAEQLLTDSGVSQANTNEYFFHGDFSRAFIWREYKPIRVVEAPPNNPKDFYNDIVLAVKASIAGVAGVWEPRFVGQSKNS